MNEQNPKKCLIFGKRLIYGLKFFANEQFFPKYTKGFYVRLNFESGFYVIIRQIICFNKILSIQEII